MIKIFFFLICVLSAIAIAQQINFNKECELKKFVEWGGKYEETSPNIYKLTYPDGISRTFNLNNNENVNNNESFDTTIIKIWEIDTTKFADYFTFWQKVQVANSYWSPLPVEDLNKNNRPELYGYTDSPDLPYPSGGPVIIFERDTDGIFKNVFEYDSSTIFVKTMGDIHRTGGKEIYIHSKLVNNGVVYRSDTVGSLPTTFDFTFYYTPNQINNMTFGDFDQNNITDCIFIDAASALHCIIGEFRDSVNNFEELFRFSTTDDGDLSGFAINDFDGDGNIEFIVGSGRHGNIYVVENIAENIYSLINQFTFPVLNAYMLTITNDIDQNGKPEYWIGGQDFENGISLFQCYEADGDNTYKVVAVIELRYLVSLFTNYIQASDIDCDGKEELIISIGNAFLILKFIGSVNEHRYKLIYAKLNEATQPGAEFYPVAIADFDGDGKKDILLPFRKYIYPITYAFSYILRQEKITNVGYDYPITSMLEQNFPNPFNPITKIKYSISQSSFVVLKVYDILGRQVATLVNEEKSSGSYTIEFNAGELSSGIYFYQLSAGDFKDAKKLILLK